MYKGGTYLALGDSITFGLGLDYTARYGTYVAKVAKSIFDNKGNVRFLNKAISGWKSGDFLNSPAYWARVKFGLVTLMIGTNDAANSITAQTVQDNISKIVDMIRKVNPDAEIILCTQCRRSDSLANGLDAYRTAVINVASSKNTYLCKFEDAWAQVDTATYMQADGLHPNSTGQQKLADFLLPIVQQTNFYKNFGK